MIRRDAAPKKGDTRIADSIIYADSFAEWSDSMMSNGEALEDVLTNAYEVKQVYEAYGDELWDAVFRLSVGEETVLECLERLAGFPIENEEDLMIQFMEQTYKLQQKERGNG